MTDFHDIASVEEAIRSRLLARYALSPNSIVTLIGVSENANFAVADPETGFHGVFRIHRHDYHQRREIQSELQWMRAIRAETDMLIPDPIVSTTGELVTCLEIDHAVPRFAVLFSRVEGRNLTLDDSTDEVYRRLGAISAELHRHAMRWRRPEGFHRYVWNIHTMVGPKARFGYWAKHPRLTSSDRQLLSTACAAAIERINSFTAATPDAVGLAHTDLHVLNLMLDGDDLWTIDFDDCGMSWYLQDIGPALACFEHGPHVEELADAWVAGYRTVRELTAAERCVLPDFVMLRRLLLLGWSATHPSAQVPGLDADLVAVTTTAADAYLSSNAG